MTTIEERYLQYLIENPTVHKIPYIHCVPELTEKIPVEYKTTSNPNVELPKEPTWDILRDINIKKKLPLPYTHRGLWIGRGSLIYLLDNYRIIFK